MADEDKEKAEKLAAAKKRFEQLKKEQQKKGKKGAGKKKDDKPADSKAEDTAAVEEPEASTAGAAPAEASNHTTEEPAEDAARRPSISVQSKQRSESFRQGNAPLSPGLEVQDLYRKQAARIEELEKENKAFKGQQEEGASRLSKAEEELESLRESSGDAANSQAQAKEVERLRSELANSQRQLAQAQQAAKETQRRVSGASSDLIQQLASKTSTIETLELELSKARNQINGLLENISNHEASSKELEERAQAAESATESANQELDAFKVSITFPSDETKAANEDPEALTKRITVLESDLRTANSNLEVAAKRAANLEQKIEALTKLHRDATNTSQAKDRELTELRSQLKRRDRPSHVRDASDFDLGEEETETGALQARIRALEAENFDLRRGIWRDKRAEFQPGMDDENGAPARSPEYEDVDLNGPFSPWGRSNSGTRQQHSTLQDVITSGISAFTGRPRDATGAVGRPRGSTGARGRKQSLGLLSEDGDDFDPEAFRLAQEEEAKRRIERVKETKRGLENWKGWRMDITEIRAQGAGGREVGAVFEV